MARLKEREKESADVDVGKEKHLLFVGLQTGAGTLEISVGHLQKLGIDLPSDPAIPFLGIFPKDSASSIETVAHPCSLLIYSQHTENANNLDVCQPVNR